MGFLDLNGFEDSVYSQGCERVSDEANKAKAMWPSVCVPGGGGPEIRLSSVAGAQLPFSTADHGCTNPLPRSSLR